jgi:hypothetical protein
MIARTATGITAAAAYTGVLLCSSLIRLFHPGMPLASVLVGRAASTVAIEVGKEVEFVGRCFCKYSELIVDVDMVLCQSCGRLE